LDGDFLVKKAKRSRRENMSVEDKIKMADYKQRVRDCEKHLKEFWAWSDKYQKATPEQKNLMLKLREEKDKGINTPDNLTETQLTVLELKRASYLNDSNNPQTQAEKELSQYARDHTKP
jgi:hypothetical protein